MMRVEIHDHDDDIAEIFSSFRVANHLLIIDLMKTEAPIALERRIVLANSVHMRDEVFQTVGAFPVPMLDLVLLRIEILLAARLSWTIFQQLEGRTVDSIIAA